MVELRVGQVIPAESIKAGNGKNGAWAYGEVKAEKGYDKLTVWFNNPADYVEGKGFKVSKIENVKKSARKYTDKAGETKWADEYSVNALLEVVDSEAPEGFATLDDAIPF